MCLNSLFVWQHCIALTIHKNQLFKNKETDEKNKVKWLIIPTDFLNLQDLIVLNLVPFLQVPFQKMLELDIK